jgi:hypothetical protein
MLSIKKIKNMVKTVQKAIKANPVERQLMMDEAAAGNENLLVVIIFLIIAIYAIANTLPGALETLNNAIVNMTGLPAGMSSLLQLLEIIIIFVVILLFVKMIKK